MPKKPVARDMVFIQTNQSYSSSVSAGGSMRDITLLFIPLYLLASDALGRLEWDPRPASVSGRGCQSATLQASGDRLELSHPDFSVAVAQGSSTELERIVCQITIPVRLEGGYYVESVSQTYKFSYDRQGSPEGQVYFDLALFGEGLKKIVSPIPYPGKPGSRATGISVRSILKTNDQRSACGAGAQKGLFKSHFILSAFRSAGSGQIRAWIDPRPASLSLKFNVKPCP